MSRRYLGGFLTASYNPLKVPNAPTIGTASAASSTSASITFTAPSNVGGGAITSYVATATDSSTGATFSASGISSPITITGLTTGNTYTIKVIATNIYGNSIPSNSSNSVVILQPYMNVTTVGATVTTSGNYKTAVFNTTGSFTVNSTGSDPTEGSSVQFVLVGGGGAGGYGDGYTAGGGGAGGYNSSTNQAVTATSYTITIGGGAAGPTSAGSFAGGSNSFFDVLAGALGGGGGLGAGSGRGGGCGGGAGTNSYYNSGGSGGAGSQGGNGGSSAFANYGKYQVSGGGGGGGVGAAGGNANVGISAGNGGVGITNPITGVAIGGGGAGSGGNYLSDGVAGTGGGGIASTTNNANNATANTGGGGGASKSNNHGGNGGSGLAIIKWRFQ